MSLGNRILRQRILSILLMCTVFALTASACGGSQAVFPTANSTASQPTSTESAVNIVAPSKTPLDTEQKGLTATAADTAYLTSTPVGAESPELTATPTSSPTETPLPTVTQTPEPEFLGTFNPENLVHTDFEKPVSATWALFSQTNSNFDTSQLEGTSIDIIINGVSHQISGENAAQQIQKMKGILIDYDETQFNSESLEIDIVIYGSDGELIYDHDDTSVTNWFQAGVVKMPLDCATNESILNTSDIQVVHLDDMDITEGLKTSFEGDHQQVRWVDGTWWIAGIQQDHGNAIDIGYLKAYDPTVTRLCLPEVRKILGFAIFNTYSSGISEFALGLQPDARVLVYDNGDYILSDLDIRQYHLTLPNEELFKRGYAYDKIIPKGTHYANLQVRGEGVAEIHIGVLSPRCYGGYSACDPYRPSIDPGALILPFNILISRDTNQQILNQLNK